MMNVLILYNSRSGHTRSTAEAIVAAAHDQHHNVKIKSVIEVRKSDIEAADVIFVGTWIQGFILFGVKPAGAGLWVRALPNFMGKPVGIFCTYAFNPHNSLQMLGKLLEAQGAVIAGQRAFHRSHPNEGAAEFVQTILGAVASR
jgi:flavodoxin